jgi:sialidase-1
MERASEGTEAVEAELEVFGRRSSSVESVGSEVQLLAPGPNGRHATFGAAAGDVPRALAPPDHFRAVGWRRRCARAPRRVKVAVAGLCVCLCAISATLLVQLRVLPAMKQQREVSDSSVVFRSFGDGSGAYACFRIPALLAVPAHDAGSHPLPFPLAARTRLLAFAEGRRSDCSDAGQIDTVLRISDDGGESWGPLHVVATAQSAGYAGHGTIGNPTPIYDARRDRVALLLTANSAADSEGEIIARTSTGGRHVFALHSDDRGRSW